MAERKRVARATRATAVAEPEAPATTDTPDVESDVVKDAAPRVVDQTPTNDLILDPEVQPRESVDMEVVADYKEAMLKGDNFQPIVVYKDSDGNMVVADGWHRVLAARGARKATILAEIREGTLRDAILHSVSANATHGLRRTDADKRKSVLRLLNDDEWSKWSANVIAGKVGVSQPYVSRLKKEMAEARGEEARGSGGTVQTADGRTMDTSRIGRPRKERPEEEETETAEAEVTATEAPVSAPAQPVATLDLDSEFADMDDNEETADPEAVYGRQLLSALAAMKDHDPKAVFAALSDEECQGLADDWEVILNQIDAYSGALEDRLPE